MKKSQTFDKIIVVVSDLELGDGSSTDDFTEDYLLVKVIDFYAKSKFPVDLIRNGDVEDFLKMGIKGIHPKLITPEISVQKLKNAAKAHPTVFESYQEFIKKKRKRIISIIGNHDQDYVFPEVQKTFTKLIHGNKENTLFPGFSYTLPDLKIIHGNSFDP